MSLEKELDIVDEMKEIRKNAKKFGIELELVRDSILFDEDVLDVIVINVSKGDNTLTAVAVPSKDDIILTVRELLMIMVDEEAFNKAVTKVVEDVHRGIFEE